MRLSTWIIGLVAGAMLAGGAWAGDTSVRIGIGFGSGYHCGKSSSVFIGYGYHTGWNRHYSHHHAYYPRYRHHYYAPRYYSYSYRYCDPYAYPGRYHAGYGYDRYVTQQRLDDYYDDRGYTRVDAGVYTYQQPRVVYAQRPSYSVSTRYDGAAYSDDALDAEDDAVTYQRQPLGGLTDSGGDHGAHASAKGWALLADGQLGAAMAVFARETERHPTLGVPRIGYALTLGDRGDLDRAALTMRQAMRVDPMALHHVPLDDAHRLLIDGLIDDYAARLDEPIAREDARFMLAALYMLNDRPERARTYLDAALDSGDRSGSLRGLARAMGEPDLER